MKSLTGQVDQVTSLPAADWNEQAQELKNLIEDLVATSTSADLDQLGKAIVNYAAASFMAGGGTANVQTATKIGDQQALSKLAAITDGYLIRYRPSVANTGAATLAVNGLAAKSIVREDGSTLSAGDLDTVRDTLLRWDQSLDKWRLLNAALSDVGNPVPARGYVDGFITRRDPVDTDHDIEIGIGIARDSTNTKVLERTSVITKKIDVAWAAGDNAGGYPTGAAAIGANDWIHVFLIRKTSDGSIDAGFDKSFTAANLLADATGYSEFLLIWSVRLDGASNIIDYRQYEDECWWTDSVQDVSAANPGTAQVSHTLDRVPPSLVSGQITAILSFFFNEPTAGGTTQYVIGHGDATLAAASGTHKDAATSSDVDFMAVHARVKTSAAQVVKTRQDRSVAASLVEIETKGFVMNRGANL